jgi:putative aminopeptidase FrvX
MIGQSVFEETHTMVQIDRQYLKEQCTNPLQTPSPTGFTERATQYITSCLEELKLKPRVTRKGGLTVDLEGKSEANPRALTAHVDTLGAMVKGI